MWPLSLTVSVRLSWAGSQKDLLDMLKCLRSSGLSVSSVKLREDSEDRRQGLDRDTERQQSANQTSHKLLGIIWLSWREDDSCCCFHVNSKWSWTHSWQPHRRDRDGVVFIWSETVCFSHFISEELIRWIFVTALRSVGLKPLLITMVTRSSLYRAEPLLRSICLIWSQLVRSRCSSTHSETCLHL